MLNSGSVFSWVVACAASARLPIRRHRRIDGGGGGREGG
jgi:hypothetical protein